MALFSRNPLNKDTLVYSGIAVFVFAIFYYIFLKNSYCNKAEILCMNPVINNIGTQPNTSKFISQSAENIIQTVKCEPLPVTELNVYSKTTNNWIALYSLIFIIITGLLLISANKKSLTAFTGTIFNKIDDEKKIINFSWGVIIISLCLMLTNYFSKGYEKESLWILVTLIILYICSILYLSYDNVMSATKFTSHIAQFKILVIIVIVILFILVTSFKHINNLEIGHAFISSGSIVILIIQILFIIYMGIALIDNVSIFEDETGMYLIYVAIFITIVIQTILLGNHIYTCIWKTYECEPEIEIQKTNNNTANININCVAKLDINKTMASFILIAILFMILPNQQLIDFMINGYDQFIEVINYIISKIEALLKFKIS